MTVPEPVHVVLMAVPAWGQLRFLVPCYSTELV